MSSPLKRELRRLEHVELGGNKNQPFKTVPFSSRTRKRPVSTSESVPNTLEPNQGVHVVEAQTDDSQTRDDPMPDEASIIRFFSMLNASALCISLASFTYFTTHTSALVLKSLANTQLSSQHVTHRGRGDRPEQAHQ